MVLRNAVAKSMTIKSHQSKAMSLMLGYSVFR
jgi:hypothetical protein